MQPSKVVEAPTKSIFSTDDGKKIVDVFAWLIKEDKKQNPELYIQKKAVND